jgi:hypothetical protein
VTESVSCPVSVYGFMLHGRAMINFTCCIWARKFANQVATTSDYHVKTNGNIIL